MNNGKIWSLLSPLLSLASPPPVRERGQSPYLGGQIIQPEFSGLRAIPLDPFDVFHFCSASFLPYFMPSSVACRGIRCKFAHPSPRNRLKISQTGIARHNQNYYISFRAFLTPVLSLSFPCRCQFISRDWTKFRCVFPPWHTSTFGLKFNGSG